MTSLALLEPLPEFDTPSMAEFGAGMGLAFGLYAEGDVNGALDAFFALLGDTPWREAVERNIPGAVASRRTTLTPRSPYDYLRR